MTPPYSEETEKAIQQLAHRLNNPLSAVIGFAELLLESKLDDQTRRDLEKIHREALRMRDVLHAAQRLNAPAE